MTALRPRALFAICLLAVLAACGDRAPPMTIVVVSLDTTRPDHLSPYGYGKPTSPTLERMAREGTLFTNARTTSPWTLPAHVSLFTGKTPRTHDVVVDFQTIPDEHPTLGEVFAAADYFTYGLFTAPYVHSRFGFDRGFDIYEDMCVERMLFDIPVEQWNAQMGAREVLSHREVTSERVANAAMGELLTMNRPRRLMFLHLFDPHYDFLAPPRYNRQFTDPGYDGTITGDNPTSRPDVFDGMPEEDLAHLQGLYDAEIRWTDDHLGRVLKAVRKRGDEGRTLVVVVADHGEEFFEHGRFGHRANLKDVVMRVPLIVWGPGLVPAGRVVDDEVSIVDVLPTVLDYAGLEPPSELDGRSLRPLIEDDGEGSDPVPVHGSLSFFPAEGPGYYVQHDSMVYEGMKIIRTVHVEWDTANESDLSGAELPGSEVLQVYDLAEDPLETRNLVDEPARADDVAFMAERLALELGRQGGFVGQESDIGLNEMLVATGYFDTQVTEPDADDAEDTDAPSEDG